MIPPPTQWSFVACPRTHRDGPRSALSHLSRRFRACEAIKIALKSATTRFRLSYLLTDCTSTTMGLTYRVYLEGERIYGCANCKTHLATIHSMMSRVRLPCGSSRTHMLIFLSCVGFQRAAWPSVSVRWGVSRVLSLLPRSKAVLCLADNPLTALA